MSKIPLCLSGCYGRHVGLVCGIEDVSVVRLDASEGAPILGVIEDVCESENAYYIVSSDMVYRYAKDGSFISSSSQSALLNPVGSISTE